MTEVRPMPDDFAPIVTVETVRGGTVWVWRDVLEMDGKNVAFEFGLRHDDPKAMAQHVWGILEHARLGNHHHVAHARVDRHSKRPRLTKGLPPPKLPDPPQPLP